jgi:LPS sulfotransferase NodH
MTMVGDQRRYFILSAGRSGSTLLAAILADAGGDFGMRVRRLNLASAK